MVLSVELMEDLALSAVVHGTAFGLPPLRVGLVGPGRQGRAFMKAAESMKSLSILGIADSTGAAVAARSGPSPWHRPTFLSGAEELCTHEGLDAIAIFTPNDLHFPLASLALRAGKHVFVEKPLGLNLSEATKLTALADDRELVLKTGFLHRHRAEFRELQRLVREERIGTLLGIHIELGHGRFMDPTVYNGSWFTDVRRSGGGVCLDLAGHAFDMARRLVKPNPNDVHWNFVSAELGFGSVIRPSGVSEYPDEEAAGRFLSDDGVSLRWETSWLECRKFMGMTVKVRGTLETLLADFGAHTVQSFGANREWKTEAGPFDRREVLAAEFNEFCSDVFRRNRKGNHDGLAAQRMIDEVYRHSARCGDRSPPSE